MGTYLMSNAYPNGPYLLTPTVVHVHPVQNRSMRSTGNHDVASNHGSIFLYFEFSLCIHCFCNIPQTTEFLLCCLYSTGISPLYFQPIPPWPVLRPRLSSRLVRRVAPPERPLVPERLLVPERTTVRSIRNVPPERRTTRFLLSLIRPTCLPIVRRLEP